MLGPDGLIKSSRPCELLGLPVTHIAFILTHMRAREGPVTGDIPPFVSRINGKERVSSHPRPEGCTSLIALHWLWHGYMLIPGPEVGQGSLHNSQTEAKE